MVSNFKEKNQVLREKIKKSFWMIKYQHKGRLVILFIACGGTVTSFITAAHPEPTSLKHDTNRLRLISGTSNTALAKEIATYMGITNVPLVSKRFADGELYVQIQ